MREEQIKEILDRFAAESFVWSGGLTLYPKPVAMDVVMACKRENVEILGIDGFYRHGDMIQPSMEDSLDFSGHADLGEDIYDYAVEFMKARDNSMFFEIVL